MGFLIKSSHTIGFPVGFIKLHYVGHFHPFSKGSPPAYLHPKHAFHPMRWNSMPVKRNGLRGMCGSTSFGADNDFALKSSSEHSTQRMDSTDELCVKRRTVVKRPFTLSVFTGCLSSDLSISLFPPSHNP